MKLLIVNPNTSSEVTDRFVAEARLTAPSDLVIEGVTGTFGAGIVVTRAENVIAGHSALDLIARHAPTFDAVILAISFDSALAAANDLGTVPVVGMTRSALDAALAVGGQIGLIIFGTTSRPLYEDLLVAYGLADRVAGIEAVTVTSTAGYLDPGAHDEIVVAAIERLVLGHGVSAVVICGAAIVGIARRLAPRVPVAVFDGAAPAVAEAMRLATARLRPKRTSQAMSTSTGLSPELTALLSGSTLTSPSIRS